MKKIIALMLCALLVMGLAACGSSQKEPDPTNTPAPTDVPATPEPAETPEPVETPADPTEAPAEEENDPVAETIALVLSMKGEPIEELIAIIGEPSRSDYTPSCMGGIDTGAEDGMLYYDGFIVYTFVSDGSEVVYECERN